MGNWLIAINNTRNQCAAEEIIIDFCKKNNLGPFAYSAISYNEKIIPSIFLYNYPQEWADYYLAHQLQNDDPIIKKTRELKLPFRWSQEIHLPALNEKEHHIIMQAKTHQINDGFTVPISDVQCNASLSLLIKPAAAVNIEPLSLISLGHVFHEKICSLYNDSNQQQKIAALSNRELECLLWAARGKTNAEIAIILDVSENTIKFHLKNVLAKFNVHTKIQAVTKALLNNEFKIADLVYVNHS